MGNKRTISISDLGPRRRGKCTWCKGPVKKPKIYWCSEECVHEYRIRSDSSYARDQVFKRDKGICCGCDLDTEALKREYLEQREALVREATQDLDERYERLGVKLKLQKFRPRNLATEHLWEMDHIIPVVEGGGACGLDNLRTLCLSCHKEESAKLAKRLAEKRRLPF